MIRSVVFVHGTGVRAAAYNETFATVRAAVLQRYPGIGVRGCYWGGAAGARLALHGASIPQYGTSGGIPGGGEDEAVAVWGVLYFDPGYELRLLGLRPRPSTGMTRGLSPTERFLRQISTYEPSDTVVAAFAARGLEKALHESLAAVVALPELREAAASVDGDGYEHRHAVARAVVAATLAAAAERGAGLLDGTHRDSLLATVSADLRSQGRVLPGAVKKAAAAPAVRAMSWQARRRRGALTDDTTPAIADILRYQARGEGIRDLIKRTIDDTPGDEITVIAHSLGGVACVDLLALEDVPRVGSLVTVGSQAPFFYEVGALFSREYPEELPSRFPRWLNVYDPRDLLSYTAARVFPGRVSDRIVNNRQPFPYAHSAYWSNEEFWDAVVTWMN